MPTSFWEISKGLPIRLEYFSQKTSIDSWFLLAEDFTSTGIIFAPELLHFIPFLQVSFTQKVQFIQVFQLKSFVILSHNRFFQFSDFLIWFCVVNHEFANIKQNSMDFVVRFFWSFIILHCRLRKYIVGRNKSNIFCGSLFNLDLTSV